MKYKHHPDTKIVLEDIKNRLQQLIEANEQYEHRWPELVKHQNTAFQSAKTIVQQAIDTGHVFRGSSAVPDGLLEYVTTPSVPERLGVDPKQSKERAK